MYKMTLEIIQFKYLEYLFIQLNNLEYPDV